jgi:hypothetical protein
MTDQDKINAAILLRDNTPIDDFLGLTPNEIHHLLYKTYQDKSLVQFQMEINDETLDKIHFFRLAEEYLGIIQRELQIKLTALGALPRKVITELYDKRLLLDEDIESEITKLSREDDCIAIQSMRLTLQLAGIVKKTNGKITLTKKGTELIQPQNRQQLFKIFFQTYTDSFFWGYRDSYTEQPLGQLGWAFTAFLLNKFGNQERLADFYADKFSVAFPIVITFFEEDIFSSKKMYLDCFKLRSFERFFNWFGLVNIKKENSLFLNDNYRLTKTELLNSIFTFDENR